MATKHYTAAGWAAILSAATTLCVFGLSFGFEFANVVAGSGPGPSSVWSPAQVAIVASIDVFGTVLGIYALVRFRDLLRERYGFHGIDNLMWVVIACGLLVMAVAYTYRLVTDGTLGSALTAMSIGAALGVLNGVIGLVFGARLLRINGNLNGYKKPLAITYLAGSVCFLLVLTAPLGMVLFAVWSVLLGLAFFRGEELEELEVV